MLKGILITYAILSISYLIATLTYKEDEWAAIMCWWWVLPGMVFVKCKKHKRYKKITRLKEALVEKYGEDAKLLDSYCYDWISEMEKDLKREEKAFDEIEFYKTREELYEAMMKRHSSDLTNKG